MGDFLSTWYGGLAIAGALTLGGALAARFAARKRVYMFGFKLGRFVTAWGDLKLGKEQWSKVENGVIVTLYDFCDGFRDGSRPEEKPEPTPPEGA